MLSSFEKNCERVDIWAEAKGIHRGSGALAQAEKTKEELDELFEALAENDQEGIDDALGDILVTLRNVAYFTGSDLNTCFSDALDIIEKRTGKMVDGKFVKD